MKTFSKFLKESKQLPLISCYAGRFQPVHLGHKTVYDYMKRQFGDCYILTSDKVEAKSPFSFEEKKYLLSLLGIPVNRIVKENIPQTPDSIFKALRKTSDSVALVFGVGKKDMESDPRFDFKPKKDGSTKYYIPYIGDKHLISADKHAYITTAPTVEFKILGKDIKSASEIRTIYKESNESNRKQIIVDLYGKFDEKAFNLFNKRLG